jgi:hypothetical protein
MEKVTKICKVCREEKTIDWFYLRTDTGKYRNDCEICRAKSRGYVSAKTRNEERLKLFNNKEKYCSRCKEVKPHSTFTKDNSQVDKLKSWCKACVISYNKLSDNMKYYGIKNRYNLTKDQYHKLLADNPNCNICGTSQSECDRRFHVDHSHETGKVRGILCFNCNSGLGMFKDSPENLESAIKYLKLNQ